ncbi:MAG: DUF1460 domain-containing protein [Arcicella sp.]|nr:DUF1460 domain-containing protein [Arcicella sp.]
MMTVQFKKNIDRFFSNTQAKKSVFFLCLLIFCSFNQTESDEEIYIRKIQNAQGSTLDDFTLNIAKSFLNRPYKAHTLEGNTSEKLVVNLREFDCTTFVETCIAMGLTYRKSDISFNKFEGYLKRLRYYNKGKIKGYDSRIHYLSDWLYTHSQDGLLTDVTPSLGGIEWKKNINFMSTHWNKYPFPNNVSLQEKIQKIEEKMNQQNYTYIPKSKVKNIENQLLNGDIIAITTNIEGLDITHVGFAIRLQDKRVYLLHASSDFKRVMVTDKPLAEYLAKNKAQTGIMVARLK